MVKVTVGIRIYPNTEMIVAARRKGKISSEDDDRLLTRFYIDNEMETWIRETIRDWMRGWPNWIH